MAELREDGAQGSASHPTAANGARRRQGAVTTVEQFLAATRASLGQRPSPHEAFDACEEGALLIDIRGDDQRRADGDIAGAIVVPRNSLEWRCDPSSSWRHPRVVDPDQRLILICNEGFQSSLAAATLRQLGLRRATDVVGGFVAWRAAGMPITPHPGAWESADSGPSSTEKQWDDRYRDTGIEDVSWYAVEPRLSLELIDHLHLSGDSPVVDVGGGSSGLIPTLAERGVADLTLLDVSTVALAAARERLGDLATRVCLLHQDVLRWQPQQRYGLWHDRAVLHFFVDIEQRARYLTVLESAVIPGGYAMFGVFAPDGPERCSELPVLRYSIEDLAAFLGDEFTLVAERRELHRTPKGVAQPFQWAIFARRGHS